MKKTAPLIFALTFLLASLVSYLPQPSYAAGASLFLTPSSGSKYVGDKFNVLLYVNSEQASNSYDVYLSTSNLTVTGFSVGGSICILYPFPPSYNNISAHFECGLPTPGYTGSNGYISAITVKGNAPGKATVSIDSNSSVLANDGSGTNILGSRGSASFTILPPPTAAPAITSQTHPDQDKWYKNSNPALSWSGNGSNFSYTLDQNSDTTPDQVSEGSATSKTYDSLADGTWYFHVIVKGSSGTWSSSSHYRIQIDTTPPEPFTPEADPSVNAEKRPIIAFNTNDKTSGVDHYELKVDNGSWNKVANPYKMPSVTSGKHTIYVKAVDKAGNEQVGSVAISVKDILPPIILTPENGSLIGYGNNLIINGKSLPNYKVKIYLDDKEIGTTTTDSQGNFQLTYKELLRAGDHKLYALAINPDNIESPKSKVVTFHLDPQSYLILGRTVPGSTLLITFILIILIITTLFIFFWLGAKRFRRKLKTVLEKLEEEVEGNLDKAKAKKEVKEEVEEEFEEAKKEVGEK